MHLPRNYRFRWGIGASVIGFIIPPLYFLGLWSGASGGASSPSPDLTGLPPVHPATKSTKSFVNSIGMAFNSIPEGSFLMGDVREFGYKDSDVQPVHKVTLSGFWMGRYEVTNEEFEHFKNLGRPPESRGNRQPESRISWQDAANFCRWLSRKEGKKYRLPTEAEWEYAARGGLTQKVNPWGNETADGRATWGATQTTPVGTYAPNGYGLYDMAGNVEEWVSDWYSDSYYAHSPAKTPQGPPPDKFKEKVCRGGFFSIWNIDCAMRSPGDPYYSYSPADLNNADKWGTIGFRVVMES